MKTILRWAVCFLSLIVVSAIMPNQLVVPGGITAFLAAGTVLWLVNMLVKPVAQIIAIPLTIVTFGIFYFIVNALLVGLAFAFFSGVESTFLACVVTAVFISLLNTLLSVGKCH